MLIESVNWDYQWAQIVARAWADNNFKQRLLAEPVGPLTEYDIPPPAGLRIEVIEDPDRVLEDTDGVMYLVLPAKPGAAELSEDELCSVGGAVAADRCGCGGCHRCHGCYRCYCAWCGCHHPPSPDEN